MNYFISFCILFFCVNVSLAQIQVSGKILSESGDVLPGATIIEKGTENEVTSNFEGEFKIKCVVEKPTLVFNFVGMLTQEVSIKSDTTFNLFLIEDKTTLREVITIGCPPRRYDIGLNTGLNYNQLGIETQNLIHRLLPFNNQLSTNFKWRFLTENQYLKFHIEQYEILNIKYKVFLGLKVNYQYISLESNIFSNRQSSVSTNIRFKGLTTWLGYARREVKNHEDVNNSQNGIALGLQKVFFRRLNFKANTIYWSDDWQYNVHLDANIPKTQINLGLDYEKINPFEEFGISVLYSFPYY